MLWGVGVAALVGCGGGGKGPVLVDYASFTTDVADISATRGALRGQAFNPNSQPLSGVTVRLSDARRQIEADSFSTTTDSQGRYGMGNVEPATYRLDFSRAGFDPVSRKVNVASGQITEVLPVALPSDGTVNHTGTVALNASQYTGVDSSATVTVTDADLNTNANNAETTTVRVTSAHTDPSGETITLTETGNDTGVFTGTFGFERPFNSTQATPITPGNGQVGVYAEATQTAETVTVTYHDAATADQVAADATATANYQEPPSTVSGRVQDRDTGQAIAGAGLLLFSAEGAFVDEAVSRSDGSYAFYEVASGTYNIVLGRQGYARETVGGVVVP